MCRRYIHVNSSSASQTWQGVLLFLFLLAFGNPCATAAQATPAVPPPVPTLAIPAPAGNAYLVFTPPAKRPPLRMLLDDKTYDDRKAEALKHIDRDALAKAKAMPCGYFVLTADPGRPANRAGVMPGDIITGIDDAPAADGSLWIGAKGEINLTWLNAARETVSAKVKGGPQGVQVKSIWPGAAVFYMQSGKKDAKWDDDCLVAASSFSTDPELAETALAHALKAGLRDDYFTDLLAAEIANTEMRFDAALQFAYFAWKQDRPASMDTLNQLLPELSEQTSFLAIGEEIFKTAGDKLPTAYHKDFDFAVMRWKGNPNTKAINLPIAAQIQTKPRWNLLTHATYTKETPAALFIQMRHKAELSLETTKGGWLFGVLNTQASDVDLSYTMNIPALDSPDTENGQRAHMISGFFDPGNYGDMSKFWSMPMISREGWLSYTLWPGYIWLQVGNQMNSHNLYMSNAIYRNYFHAKLKWRMISYAHWTEVYLNDEVVFRAPSAAPMKNVGAFFRIQGGKMELSGMKFEEILDQAKADTPMAPDPELPKAADF